jgi:hypothetical protein
MKLFNKKNPVKYINFINIISLLSFSCFFTEGIAATKSSLVMPEKDEGHLGEVRQSIQTGPLSWGDQ